MLIALDWNQHFRTGEGLLDWRRAVGLRLVPLRIQLWCRVDVVLRGIAVSDAEFLVCLDAEHVRYIVAATLIESARESEVPASHNR